MRHVALSGDGEPTLSPQFAEVVQAVVHIRALGGFPFFKIVLLTNGTGLDRPQVQESLKRFTKSDEIWVKLDGGTQEYLDKVCRLKDVTLGKILSNILHLARQRPVVIQSLFPAINGEEPSAEDIEQFAHRLKELKSDGAQISTRADLFRQPSYVARRMRASAAQDPFPHRPSRPAGGRLEG